MKSPFLIALLFTCWHGLAQANPPLWQRMEQAFEACDHDPVKAEIRARQMLTLKTTREECDSLLLVEFLLRNSANLLGTEWPPLDFELPQVCNRVPSPLLFVRGVTAFRDGEHEMASNWFRKAAEVGATESVINQQQALQALGATLTHLNRYREALAAFQAAFDLDPETLNPIEFNNFAFANLVIGRCTEAIDWCNLALEEIAKAVKEDDPFVEYLLSERNAVLLTRLYAEIQQGDETACERTLAEIELQGTWNGRELAAACALTNHALWTNDPERFAAIRPVLLTWLESESHSDALMSLGASCALFESSSQADWRGVWDRVREVPAVFRGAPGAPCEATEFQAVARRPIPFAAWAMWGLLLGTLGAATYGVVLWKRRRQLVALDGLNASAWEGHVEAALLKKGKASPMERMLALRALRNLAHQEWFLDQIHSAQIQQWPPLEQHVARQLAAGVHTKAIAQELGISVSTVYKTRHAIRTRLDLKPNDSLRKRLQEMIQIVAVLGTLLGGPSAWAQPDELAHLQSEVITAIHLEDSARWNRAMTSLRQLDLSELPAPFDVALAPMADRPGWAQVPDSTWWHWFRAGSSSLELALSEEAPDGLLEATSADASKVWIEQQLLLDPDYAPFLLLVLLILVGAIIGTQRSMSRPKLQPTASNWPAIAAGLKNPEALDAALASWKIIKASQPRPVAATDFWELLTSAEQEVAQYLAQDWTVAQIAQHMSCSPGNVYNLRSSIRGKWSLDASDDLVRFIQALQAEND